MIPVVGHQETRDKATEPGPIPANGDTGRIVYLDFLRGLGVMMILVSNIQEFSMPRAGYFFPNVYGDFTGLNKLVWHLDNLVFNGKSLLVFSLLFGMGLILQESRRAGPGRDLNRIHYRRMLFLLTLGLGHAFFVWDGDILVCLSLAGMAVFPLRFLAPRILLVWSAGLIVAGPALTLGLNHLLGFWDLEKMISFGGNLIREEGALRGIIGSMRGGWIDQMAHRIPASMEMYSFNIPVYLFWFVSSAMVLGMALVRSGFLAALSRKPGLIWFMTLAFVIGVPGTFLNLHHGLISNTGPTLSFIVSAQYDYWLALIVTAGIIIFSIVFVREIGQGMPVSWVVAVGRMAISNYFFQSLICTAVFYGHGFGLFGKISRSGQFFIVLLIWALMIAASRLWLKYFRFGPLEWAWRSFYLQKRIPFRL